jgi:hypothetical protein
VTAVVAIQPTGFIYSAQIKCNSFGHAAASCGHLILACQACARKQTEMAHMR